MKIQHRRFWLTSFTLLSALLLTTSPSMAQTDEECERLYGTTCNHQNDIEQQQQETAPQQPSPYAQYSEVCQAYPTSYSCTYTMEGSSETGFMNAFTAFLTTVPGQTFASQHCSSLRSLKQTVGQHWTGLVEEFFYVSVNRGTLPYTQLEYNLQMWASQTTVKGFCPDML